MNPQSLMFQMIKMSLGGVKSFPPKAKQVARGRTWIRISGVKNQNNTTTTQQQHNNNKTTKQPVVTSMKFWSKLPKSVSYQLCNLGQLTWLLGEATSENVLKMESQDLSGSRCQHVFSILNERRKRKTQCEQNAIFDSI